MSDTTSELVWYIARDGQQHGPITDHEMRVFVDNGHMKPGDLVWNPQLTDWKPAEEVFPKPAPPPVAPPPPPKPVVTAAPEKTAAPQPAADKPLSQASPTSEARSGRSAEPAKPTASEPLPAPEDVLPSLRVQRSEPSPMAARDTAAASKTAGTRLADPETTYAADAESYDEPSRGRRIGMLVGGLAVVAALAGGGYVAFQNQDAILGYMNQSAAENGTTADTPVVKADEATKTASLEKPAKPTATDAEPAASAPSAPRPAGPRIEGITVTIPPSAPTDSPPEAASGGDQVPLDTIDSNLQKSQLWRVVKDEFPDWYQERVQEISRLSNSASETDLSKHLIGKLVALRREHANQALASSTEHLQSIAGAFLANLKSLAGHSTEACYTFISRGETSPAVISLFPKPGYGDAIEGQIAAVFRAVADGRKTPVQRDKAGKPDYDVLAQELTKLGWTKEDLGLFSNPQALAKAPPERVCKMVQDWFTAHVSIQDKAVQERLLVETLRPVVAG